MSKIRRSFSPEDRYSIVQEAMREGHADWTAEADLPQVLWHGPPRFPIHYSDSGGKNISPMASKDWLIRIHGLILNCERWNRAAGAEENEGFVKSCIGSDYSPITPTVVLTKLI